MTKEETIETEVCVVGGGPAGSTIARSLAQLGHDVCLLERSAFPRPHVGESLSPTIFPILDALGLRERIESAPFIRTSPPIVRWSGRDEQTELTTHVPGLLVDRGLFDHLLLTAASEVGVIIIQPAQAATPVRRQSNSWSIQARGTGRTLSINAQLLVDAMGRSSFLKGRRKRTSVPTLALYGYWRNTDYSRTQTFVEAGPNEWYWGSPLPGDLFNAMVFIDPKRCGNKSSTIENLYRTLLSQSSLLRDCLHGTLETDVRACSSSSFFDEECVDESFIKVGEASFAIDPLSSQGVQVAIQSAAHGAIVVHTLLQNPEHSAAALQFYRARQNEIVKSVANATSNFYAEQHTFRMQPFWIKRSQKLLPGDSYAVAFRSGSIPIGRRLRITETSRLRDTPVIDGNIIRYGPALHAPFLSRPLAFIGGFDVQTLFSTLEQGLTVTEVIQKWATRMTASQSLEILQWLWSRNLIVAHE